MWWMSPRLWAAGALAALIAFAGVQTVRVGRLKADRDRLENLAAEALRSHAWEKARADTCNAAVARQNAALTALEAVSRDKIAQADKAAADARAVAASARKQADALLAARLKGANACERAADVQRRFEQVVP